MHTEHGTPITPSSVECLVGGRVGGGGGGGGERVYQMCIVNGVWEGGVGERWGGGGLEGYIRCVS